MEFKDNIFERYLQEAPLPLAIERWFECEIYNKKTFERPILDIGCGEGMYAYLLFDEKIDTGIDPNARELKRAEEYGAYIELLNCFGDKIPKDDKSYKTIFSNSVLEHIPAIDDVLQEANRLLDDDGKMYVTIPTDLFDKYSVVYQLLSKVGLSALAEKFRIKFNRFWAHFHYYDQSGWQELFEKNGFVVSDVQTYAGKKICLLNDFLAPFSVISFIVKKLINRWFIFKKLRFVVAKLLNKFFLPFLKRNKNQNDQCGLIFFELSKK